MQTTQGYKEPWKRDTIANLIDSHAMKTENKGKWTLLLKK